MFACDQPVILPHVSRQKCTCMDCNAMCPKINNTKIKSFITENSTFIQKFKFQMNKFHRVTIVTIGIYIVFVILFIFSNILFALWNLTKNGKKKLVESKIIMN